MPKRISQNELDIIVDAIAAFPDGARIEEIQNALDDQISRRSLQRRLTLLVKQNRLNIDGLGRATRYHLLTISGEGHLTAPLVKIKGHGETYIPLSPEGEKIKQSVRQSIQNRIPVGYNRTFLDSYLPNHTFYLPPEVRHELYQKGRSLETQRPAGTYARQIFNRLLIDLTWNSSRLEGDSRQGHSGDS